MGKLIVLEGTDGSGKATQTKQLYNTLISEGVDCRKIEFPRYAEPSAALIKSYLAGYFDKSPTNVNAYAASTFYAVDRYASYKNDWGMYYENGGIVLADRYISSNIVHQGCKLHNQDRIKFWEWEIQYETELLRLPKPDLTIYLDVPVSCTEKNMKDRELKAGTSMDIHESNMDYLSLCRATASQAADLFGWKRIQCVEDDQMRSIEDIAKDVYEAVKAIL